MSAQLAIAEPRRIKATHRRRRRIASGPSVQRYYDPQIGRFLSVDPVSADPNTGAMFNRFAYGANNPYRFTDPDGRKAKAKTDEDKPRTEHEGTSTENSPEDEQYNCHSYAWHNSQGDPTDQGNKESGQRWDQSPKDDMKNAEKLDPNAPNKPGDILVYGIDSNGNGRLEKKEIQHSALVTVVDGDGNTVRVESKEGNGPITDHHPFDQNPAYGTTDNVTIEWYRK